MDAGNGGFQSSVGEKSASMSARCFLGGRYQLDAPARRQRAATFGRLRLNGIASVSWRLRGRNRWVDSITGCCGISD
jgi:hypothetical protein